MARKVLLIGLGSTGWEFCEHVLEKLELEWSSSECTPWIKLLAYDTDQVEGGGINRLGRGFRMKLSDSDVRALKTDAKKFDPTMDLTTWYDPQVVSQMNRNSPGAGNTRQAARIVFLFKDNAERFYRDVKDSLERLSGMDEKTVKSAAAKSGMPNVGQITIESPDEILVFIAGSAAGGTGSGSLIDAGYFVKRIARDNNLAVDVKGIVLLPPMSHGNVAHKANAFALLKELNHYQQRHVQWEGSFPIQGMERVKAEPGDPPFDDCFVGVPKAKSEHELNPLSTLLESFAQFVYLSAVGNAANRLNAALINPKTLSALTENVEGCPESFHSLGVGVIEYPAAQVFKACAAKLGLKLATKWASNTPTDKEAVAALSTGLGLSSSDIVGSTNLVANDREQLRQSIRVAAKSGNPSTQFQMISSKLQKDAMGGTSKGDTVPSDRLIVAQSRFEQFVQASLMDYSRGPKWLQAVLSSVQKSFDTLADEASEAEKRFEAAGKRTTEAINNVSEAESDPIIRMIPGWKKRAVAYWSRKLEDSLSDRLAGVGGARLRASANESQKVLMGDPAINRAGLIEKVKERLGGEGHKNVLGWLQEFEASCRETHDKIDNFRFEINGVALFEPEFTVNQAYTNCISKGGAGFTKGPAAGLKNEESCAAALGASFGAGIYGELMTAGASRFDTASAIVPDGVATDTAIWTDSDAQNLRQYARPLFISVFNTSVLEELWKNQAMAPTSLKTVRDVFARPFVELDTTLLKQINREPGQDVAPYLAMIPDDNESLKARTMQALSPKETVTSVPWRLAIVRGECMFSMQSVIGVCGENSYERWYNSEMKNNEPTPGRHLHSTLPLASVKGVPNSYRAQRRKDEGMFLCCLGVGLIDSVSFVYKMREVYGFDGQQERTFPHDIAAAGDLLSDERLRTDMNRAFDAVRKADTERTEVSKRLREFIQRASAYELKYKGKVAPPEKIAEFVAEFAMEKGFWQEIKSEAKIRMFVSEPVFVLSPDADGISPKIASKFKRPGLYCDNPNCGVLLVERHELPNPDGGPTIPESEADLRHKLPAECPDCKTIIKNL